MSTIGFFARGASPPVETIVSSVHSGKGNNSRDDFLCTRLTFFLLLPGVLIKVVLPEGTTDGVRKVALTSGRDGEDVIVTDNFFVIAPEDPTIAATTRGTISDPPDVTAP